MHYGLQSMLWQTVWYFDSSALQLFDCVRGQAIPCIEMCYSYSPWMIVPETWGTLLAHDMHTGHTLDSLLQAKSTLWQRLPRIATAMIFTLEGLINLVFICIQMLGNWVTGSICGYAALHVRISSYIPFTKWSVLLKLHMQCQNCLLMRR